jgi:hypothetical protein
MEILKTFFTNNSKQLQNIFNSEKKNNSESILIINYTKIEDIKVSCFDLSSIEKKILTQLETVKEKHNETTNKNYAITISDNNINIIKYL